MADVVEQYESEICGGKNAVAAECHIPYGMGCGKGSILEFRHVHAAPVVVKQIDIAVGIRYEEIVFLPVIAYYVNGAVGKTVAAVVIHGFTVVGNRHQILAAEHVCSVGSLDNFHKGSSGRRQQAPRTRHALCDCRKWNQADSYGYKDSI